jgi:hypothetical protein
MPWHLCCSRSVAAASVAEREISSAQMVRFAGRFKIILSVSLSGKRCSRAPVWRSCWLADARVLPGQLSDLHGRNKAVRNGKEKVYGSIP